MSKPKPDITKLLAEHIRCNAEAIRLLKKALALSNAGKKDLARATEKRAQKWIDHISEIEGKKR